MRLFGEGLALKGDRLVQLTWNAGRALVYMREDFELVDTFFYEGEGWGLTHNGQYYIMSNGSDTLYYRDSAFRIVRTVAVTLNARPLTKLNELECARGMIYANVWYSNFIFEIHAKTGVVSRIIDCRELVEKAAALDESTVLNGIAYDKSRDVFFITGKKWPAIFEVKIE